MAMESSFLNERSINASRSDRYKTFSKCRDEGLTESEVFQLRRLYGMNELPINRKPQTLMIFVRCFVTNPVALLLWVTSVIDGIIGRYHEMAIMLGIQLFNSGLYFYKISSVEDMELRRVFGHKASCKREGLWSEIEMNELVPGDLVLLARGATVPADCFVNQGCIEVDESSVTGHCFPVKMNQGDLCRMGSIVTSGEVQGTVDCIGTDTYIGKTIRPNKALTGRSLHTVLLGIFIPMIVFSVVLCGIYIGFWESMSENNETQRLLDENMVGYTARDSSIIAALSFTVALIVTSTPVAIDSVFSTILASGSTHLAQEGAVVKVLAAIEEMAGMDILCCDKTGTMTLNKMEIQEDCPTDEVGSTDVTKENVLLMAALASNWTQPPSNAIDLMILDPAVNELGKCDAYRQHGFTPFDPTLRYSEGLVEGLFGAEKGQRFRVRKGAPELLLEIAKDKPQIEFAVISKIKEYSKRGIRCLAVARHNDAWQNEQWVDDGDWRLLGIITFLDPPRPDAKITFLEARKFGVEIKMITGDNLLIATETAKRLQLGVDPANPKIFPARDVRDKDILPYCEGLLPTGLPNKFGPSGRFGDVIIPADGFALVPPEKKAVILATLQQANFRCGMAGDGNNDIQALKQANIGIAVSGATDEARDAAQIVLVRHGLNVIILAIKIAREIFARLKNFTLYRMASIMQLLLFFVVSLFSLKPIDYYHANFCPKTFSNGKCWSSAPPFVAGRMTAQGEKFFSPSVASVDPGSVYYGDWQPGLEYTFYMPTPRSCSRASAGSRCEDIDSTLPAYSECVLRNNDGSKCAFRPNLAIIDANRYVKTGFAVVNRTNLSPFDGCTLPKGCNLNPIYLSDASNDVSNRILKYPSQFLGSTTVNSSLCLIDIHGQCMSPPIPWPEFFQLPALMLMIITLLSNITAMSMSFDSVVGAPNPQRWNLPQMYVIAMVLVAVPCGSSLLLLWAGLDSNNPDGLFAGLGIPPLEYGKVITMMFLKLSSSDLLTVLASRTQEDFFWTCRRGMAVIGAVFISLSVATVLAILWPISEWDRIPVMGLALGGSQDFPSYRWMALWVWLYCGLCFFIQDSLKVATFKILNNLTPFQTISPHELAQIYKTPQELDADLKTQLSKEQHLWSSWPRRTAPDTPSVWRLSTP